MSEWSMYIAEAEPGDSRVLFPTAGAEKRCPVDTSESRGRLCSWDNSARARALPRDTVSVLIHPFGKAIGHSFHIDHRCCLQSL